jgi:hypothetical protein
MPLGLIAFEAEADIPDGAEDAGEIPFSLLIDGDIQVNGFWKETSSGGWVNLASAEYGGQVTQVGNKTRLDFVIADNGPFDSNPAAGAVTDPGAPGYRELDPEPEPVLPRYTLYLDNGPSNINIDGYWFRSLDFGGQDTYTLLPHLRQDVQIVDNQAGIINLPAGLVITGARFLSDGLELTINDHRVTLLGDPAANTYVMGGTPVDLAAGEALDYDALAEVFGTRIPDPGSAPNLATNTGVVQGDGTLEARLTTTNATVDPELLTLIAEVPVGGVLVL